MSGAGRAKTVFRFGIFEFDAEAGELRRQGMKVRLAGQPIEILAMLLERPSRVVTREELRARLWPANTFVEFEHSLNAAVMRLRQALGDDADTPRFVETLPRRGYRFLADVTPQPDDSAFNPVAFVEGFSSAMMPAVSAAEPPESVVTEKPVAPRLSVARLTLAFAALAALCVGGFLAWRAVQDRNVRITSLAVLPLANFSADPQQEFFADGMTEELTTDLSKIEALRVISRTSVMRYKGTKKTLPEIARELNVDAVIEGSVQREADRVRITMQLVRAADERHLWGRTYDRELKDILKLHEDVARDVAQQVQISLTPKEAARIQRGGTRDGAAYEAFLKGRQYMDRQQWAQAVPYLREAVRRDPNYALGWANLSEALGMVTFSQGRPFDDDTMNAGMRACVLDDQLAECHSFQGDMQFYGDWNWTGGEAAFRRAVQLDPGSDWVRLHLGACLLALGRNAEALNEFTIAQNLDPGSPLKAYWKARAEENLGRFDDARRDLSRAIELAPHDPGGYFWLADLEAAAGRKNHAFDLYMIGLRESRVPSEEVEELRRLYASSGWDAMIKRRWELVLRRHKASGKESAYQLAAFYAGAGDKDQAMRWLYVAFDQRSPRMTWLKTGREWAPIRGDQRFEQLVRKMNYPD